MTGIANKEKVTAITMWPDAYVKCGIGQDWYKCEFEVTFIPGSCYPDYMKIREYIMASIDGHELNIEEAARLLYDHLMLYAPEGLKVINHVTNCRTHFDVDIEIG